jgi:hypothetical protein
MSVSIVSNGVAYATNFPYDIGGLHSQLNLISGAGSWSLNQKYAAWKIDFTFSNRGNVMEIRKWKNSIVLTLTLDDPDSGKTIVFEKVQDL